MINQFPFKMQTEDFYLEAFSEANQMALWSAIQEDRAHPKRKGIWPGMKSFEDLKSYMDSCNNVGSEEYGYLIYDSACNQLGTAHVFDINKQTAQCEIGFGLHIKSTGSGWATKTVSLLEAELVKIGFKKIIMSCQVWNEKSLAVAARSNFQRTKIFHAGKDHCEGCDDCTVLLAKTL